MVETGTGSLSSLTVLKPNYTPSSGETGDLTFTLQAFGNGSCAVAQDNMVLHVTPYPSANAGTDQSTCSGVPFNLSTSLSTPAASEYSTLKWTDNGTGTWLSGADNILFPTYIPGAGDNGKTVNLTLTAYGNGSCSTPATDVMILTVKPLPITSAIIGTSNFCTSTSQVYKVDLPSGTPLSTYAWGVKTAANAPNITSFNNIAILDFGNIGYSSNVYVVETNNGCNGDSVFLPVHAYPVPVANAGNDTTFCVGSSYTLGGNPSALGGSGNYRYSWTPGTGLNNSQIANPVATPVFTTQYTLLVSDLTSGCSSGADNVNVTVNSIPAAPNASNKSACFQSTIPSLDASGTNIKWYSDALLTNLVYSGSPFNTGKTNAGTYTYYVTQTSNGCTSAATTVTLTIYGIPSQPTATNKSACTGQAIPNLSATGSNIRWYSDVLLTSMVYGDTSYNTGKSQAGTYTYYVTQSVNNCQSNPATVSLTIYAPPSPPATNDITVCKGQNIPNLIATGNNIRWYSDVGLLNLVYSGSSFPSGNTLAGSYLYYVTQTNNGCQSTSVSADLIINPSPIISNVVSTPQSVCNSNDASITITASGTAPMSYSINGGLNYASTNSFTGLSQGSYPIMVKNGYNCILSGTTISIINGGAPQPPGVSGNKTYCQGAALNSMVATANVGGILTWYSDPNLAHKITTGPTLNPSNIAGTTNYYVTETKDTCESIPASIAITINALPPQPVISNRSICYGDLTTLTATGTNITWYSNSTLVTQVATGNFYTPSGLTAGNYTYWLAQNSNSCRGLQPQ